MTTTPPIPKGQHRQKNRLSGTAAPETTAQADNSKDAAKASDPKSAANPGWKAKTVTRASLAAPKPAPVFKDKFLSIISNQPVSQDQLKTLAATLEKEWHFDLLENDWKDKAPLDGALKVELLSDADMKKKYGAGTDGISLDDNTIAVPVSVATGAKMKATTVDTLAHEENHIQDGREGTNSAGKDKTNAVPMLLQEGKAWGVGDRAPGLANNRASLDMVRSSVREMSAKTAARYVAGFRKASSENDPHLIDNGEQVGALYVEFLRTRLNGSGVKDAIPRLAQMTRDVGQGQTFDQAFEKEFGMLPRAAEASFVQYMKLTEGHPRARLAGTIYADAGT